jgi:hypothetical protein
VCAKVKSFSWYDTSENLKKSIANLIRRRDYLTARLQILNEGFYFLFCTMTNKCTINWQIIILLLHVSALLCHPQGVRGLLKSHGDFNKLREIILNFKLYYQLLFFLNLFITHAPLLGVILHAIIYMLISFAGNAVTGIIAPFAAFPLQF